jgi:hypothetical protein
MTERKKNRLHVMVDVETDGPIPGDYSMICLGAIVVEPELSRTFYGQLRPISERYDPEALAISGFSREETMGFDLPQETMWKFAAWIPNNQSSSQITTASIGASSTGTSTTFSNETHSDIALKTSDPSTRVSSKICARTSNTCEKPNIHTTPSMMHVETPKPFYICGNRWDC